MLGPWFVMLYFVSVLYVVLPSSLWVREGALLTFIVFLISCCSHRSTSSLRTVGWYKALKLGELVFQQSETSLSATVIE